MCLPMLLLLHIEHPGARRIKIWLPLFLLWLLLLCLVLLLLPLLLIACICLIFIPQGKTILRILVQVYAVLCALRGLSVDICHGAEIVKVIFI